MRLGQLGIEFPRYVVSSPNLCCELQLLIISCVSSPNSFVFKCVEPTLKKKKIKLGAPAKEFRVIIDTGSDLLWLNCQGCLRCPPNVSIGNLDLV